MQVQVTPADAGVDTRPDRGLTITATGGRIIRVSARRSDGQPVTGRLDAAATSWRSRWSLGVARRYTVTVTAQDPSGAQITRKSSFRTFAPKKTISTRIVEGYGQTYGVGMPIILYFDRPITNRRTVERTLSLTTSKKVTGAWYWDGNCGTAPECLYFRPKKYWRPHTRVHLVAHLDGVRVAPGVYGNHTLTQSFQIGRSVKVLARTDQHTMTVYRDGRVFAHWPISSGRAGDETADGTYLTIEKANPVRMVGDGYDLQVPFSVRITWSGEYLHDAPWSVGQQGFSNVSHGCINMAPAAAETFYNMTIPGDPVKVTGSPKPGVWDNGWTVWFKTWKQWKRGSALHRVVRAGPHGSTFVGHPARRRGAAPPHVASRTVLTPH